MKRFFAKLGHFFWSWGFLKFILWSVTLIVLFYAEEDWRGARAWAATKAEWEAKGESFDYTKFIPPPIPDDQNLGAIPLFKLEPDPNLKDPRYLYPLTLRRAMREKLPGNNLPLMGNWQEGKLPDLEQMRQTIATDYVAAFKGAEPPKEMLAQFDALYPFLTDLRTAAETRPFCRFAEDYTVPSVIRIVPLLVDQLNLSRILTVHAILALDDHQPDLALADLKTIQKLRSGVKRDPSLIGGLIALAMNTISDAALYYGLTLHTWNDSQLAELQQMLKSINFLADYQFAMRSEAVGSAANVDYFKKYVRLSGLHGLLYTASDANVPLMSRFPLPWPSGWWDHNKGHEAAYLFHELGTVDPQSRRVFPKADLDLQRQVEHMNARWDATAPWNFLFFISASLRQSPTPSFAQGQVWVDEAQIACALERHRLAHGVYPESLDALTPSYIAAMPHDIINSEPYHYRVRPDGTFLLYSVGWNEKDDGGKVVYEKDTPSRRNLKEGDWVWPTPP